MREDRATSALASVGIVAADELEKITRGLRLIRGQLFEGLHMSLENALESDCGRRRRFPTKARNPALQTS